MKKKKTFPFLNLWENESIEQLRSSFGAGTEATGNTEETIVVRLVETSTPKVQNLSIFDPDATPSRNFQIAGKRLTFSLDDSDDFSGEEDENSKESDNQERSSIMARYLLPQEIQGLIPAFDNTGIAVEKWLEKIEKLQATYKWEDNEVLLYATTRLKGAPDIWLKGEDLSDWKTFKDKITKSFRRAVSLADVHSQLSQMTKKDDETYELFAYRVKALGKPYGVDEKSLISYVVRGLSNDPAYQALIGKSFTEYDTFVETLRECEVNLKMRRPRPSNPNKKPGKGDGKSENSDEKSTQSKIRCFNCNEHGHKSSSCTKPKKPQCSNCKKYGHTEPECTAKKSVIIVTKSSDNGSKEHTVDKTSASEEISTDRNGMVKAMAVINRKAFNVDAIIDSGSSVSLIKLQVLTKLNINYTNNTIYNEIFGINSSPLNVKGKVSSTLILNNRAYTSDLLVVGNETSNYDMVLGRDFLKDNNICRVTMDHSREIVPEIDSNYSLALMKQVVSAEDDLFEETEKLQKLSVEELDVGNDEETYSYRGKVEELFRESYLNREKSDNSVEQEVEIKLKEDKVFSCSPQRLSEKERSQLNKMIDDLLEKGVIRHSNSPYASRVVLVRKGNGDFRMCINYRPLNKLIVRDRHPLPVIESLLPKLRDKKYFAKLDLKNGFYHVSIHENSKKYTAFVTEDGQFEFNKLPFGYGNSPSEFVRFINKVFFKMMRQGRILIFIDDLLIAAESIDGLLELLKEVLETLADNGIQLQLKKCEFLKTEVEFVGYKIRFNQISPTDRHIESIKKYPVPSNNKSLHRFIGFVSYFRKYIPGFNKICNCLYDLLKDVDSFKFGPSHYEAFNRLKNYLMSRPVLAIYSANLETQLHTDASSWGFGGILLQRQQTDNQFHPVSYYSRKTTEAESKLHSFELETLAVWYSMQRFRDFLFGIHFVAVTDCQAMKLTLEKRDVNPKIARWALYFSQFDFEIVHRPGDRMRHVDALSRVEVCLIEEDEGTTLTENVIYVNQLRDGKIQKLKVRVENGQLKDYEVREGIMYKREGARLLLVVPESMVESIIHKFHNNMGHFGVDKTVDVIRKSFYFPKMRQLILDHIKKCIICILYNPIRTKHDGKMFIPESPTRPFEVVHTDHLGPLEVTKAKNVHILAVICSLTKFVKLYATKTTKSSEVIKHLTAYLSYYPKPRMLVSDRGTAFTSKEFKKFVATKQIKHTAIATACPQANGQMERYNRTLVPLLAKLVEERNTEWDKVLGEAEFLLNNLLNRSIQDVPSRVLFGHSVGIDLRQELLDYLHLDETEDVENIDAIRRKASENSRKLQEYNKEKFDERCHAQTTYNENDLVMLKTTKVPGENSKLKPKFKGPYVVRKVLDRNRYVVGDLEGYQVSGRAFEGIFDPCSMRLYQEKYKDQENSEEFNLSQEDDEYFEDVEYLEDPESEP